MADPQKAEVRTITDFDPAHIKTYSEALIAFTSQVSIQNSLLQRILENTDDTVNVPVLLKSIKEGSDKVIYFLESKDGLDKLLNTHRDTTKVNINELGASIVLRISLILAAAGLLFNGITFYIQKLLNPNMYELVKEVVKEVIKQTNK